MRIQTLIIVISGLFGMQAGIAQSDDLDMEGRQLRMAEQTILWSKINGANPKVHELCKDHEFACIGDVAGELAIALIAARDTPRSRSALVRLVRFKLDAGGGEDFSCHVLNKGKAVRSLLLKVNPDSLRLECEAEFANLMKSNSDMPEGPTADQVCATPKSIRTRITGLASAIDQKQPCPF